MIRMRSSRVIPVWYFEAALVTVTVFWGASFVVLKGALDSITPGWLLFLRFFLASAAIAVLLWGRVSSHLDARHVGAGVAIGVPEGLAFLVQNVGLVDTTPGRNAFLTASYCVMVPFIAWMLAGSRPRVRDLGCALVCLAGIGLVSLRGDLTPALSRGDVLTLVGAAFFALNIVFVDRHGRGCDVVTITFVELVVSSLVCLAWALLSEPLPTGSVASVDLLAQMAYVTLVSTLLAMLLQNLAQQHVEQGRAALLMSLESVFATLFSIAFYGERLTLPVTLGFGLILAAVVASQLVGRPEPEVVS